MNKLLSFISHPCTKCHTHISRIHELEEQLGQMTIDYNDVIDEYNELHEKYEALTVQLEKHELLNDVLELDDE